MAGIEKSPFQIPLVDFSKYLRGNEIERTECVAEIMKGFTSSGFVYLRNSGLSPKNAFEWSEKYFSLPLEEKQKFPNVDPAVNRGYSGIGVEKVTNAESEEDIATLRAMVPDIKESIEIGSESSEYPTKPHANHWPESIPGFREAMNEFFSQCDHLHRTLLSAIAEGLGIAPTYFDKQIAAGDHCMRLLHYPAVPKAVLTKENAVRAGLHTDYGTVTLLFQDGSGGLQVRTPNGDFLDVPPIDDSIVINAGDLLQIWSNDVIKSTYHRVVSPPDAPTTDDDKFSARYSIAFFAHPDHDKVVEAIETCWDEVSRPKKYGPIMPIDWMIKRLAATY
ncbi:hypothetical protein AAFC00_003957 [Neodothiora populina]|uniref:Fe2OG dioxygenase domain-containing protein n=1 Tax=Neodothiora populina TaxID=2781224 RepID=A0ABR3PI17_9PEZI